VAQHELRHVTYTTFALGAARLSSFLTSRSFFFGTLILRVRVTTGSGKSRPRRLSFRFRQFPGTVPFHGRINATCSAQTPRNDLMRSAAVAAAVATVEYIAGVNGIAVSGRSVAEVGALAGRLWLAAASAA